jgi:hypothetical protein
VPIVIVKSIDGPKMCDFKNTSTAASESVNWKTTLLYYIFYRKFIVNIKKKYQYLINL